MKIIQKTWIPKNRCWTVASSIRTLAEIVWKHRVKANFKKRFSFLLICGVAAIFTACSCVVPAPARLPPRPRIRQWALCTSQFVPISSASQNQEPAWKKVRRTINIWWEEYLISFSIIFFRKYGVLRTYKTNMFFLHERTDRQWHTCVKNRALPSCHLILGTPQFRKKWFASLLKGTHNASKSSGIHVKTKRQKPKDKLG